MADDGHFTQETEGRIGSVFTIEDARKAHHLATADPEPERGDGLLTGPAHDRKYDLERAEASEANWRAHGVHPFENRALVEGEDGAENLRGVTGSSVIETTADSTPVETTAAPRAGAPSPASGQPS